LPPLLLVLPPLPPTPTPTPVPEPPLPPRLVLQLLPRQCVVVRLPLPEPLVPLVC